MGRKKFYTVVALCLCGCETSRVDWVKAASAKAAAKKVKRGQDSDWPIKPIAVFEGRHQDKLELSHQ